MENLFLKILEMSLAGSACIVIVLALRLCLRSKPRGFSYVLWAAVFLRLLCPFTLQSSYFGLDLGNMGERLENAAYEREVARYQMLVRKDGTVETSVSHGRLETSVADAFEEGSGGAPTVSEPYPGMDRAAGGFPGAEAPVSRRYSRSEVLFQQRTWVVVGSLIWGAGAAVLLGYSLVSYLLLRGRLRQAVRIQEDVYESERIHTPFLLGIFDPRIYLPVGLPQEERAYVLAHELVHLKRRDYLVKTLAWLAVSLHWFNPAVWLAYGLMARDMEMSCDERVIRRLGEGSKKAYSKALLAISGASGEAAGRRVLTVTPLGFGENDIRRRVKNILAYRGVRIGTGVILAALLVALGLFLMTDVKENGADEAVRPAGESQPVSKEQPAGESQPVSEELPGAGDAAAADGHLEERELTEPERTGSAVWERDATGVDEQDGSVVYHPQQDGALDEQPLDGLESLKEMDRGSEMTWELLQTLVEQKNPQLEDYAGYAGATWPEEDLGLSRRLIYNLEDTDSGQSYRLDVYYDKEDLELGGVYLHRESDRDVRLLYDDRVAEGGGLWRFTEIDAFRRDIRQLGDWVSGWELPHGEQVEISPYRADLFLGGGVLFTWKEESRNLEEMWAPEEWKSAGGFSRVWREEEMEGSGPSPFLFDADGRLTDMRIMSNHSDENTDSARQKEILEGCQEQAILLSMNHDLYTLSERADLEEAGRPVPEEETTANIWYIGFAREDVPYGYILFLSERYYTREEAVAMARSVRFTDGAWQSGS